MPQSSAPSFGDFAAACDARMDLPVVRRPGNALNVEHVSPQDRCREQPPEHWPSSGPGVGRWLASGGSPLVLGTCRAGGCPRLKEVYPMCSCGNASPHPIARKTTSDGVNVHVWSDGMVTDASIVAGYLPGVGRRRVPAARLWAFAGEVCLCPVGDLASLVTDHQRAEKRQAAMASRAVELHPNAIVGRGRSLYR